MRLQSAVVRVTLIPFNQSVPRFGIGFVAGTAAFMLAEVDAVMADADRT